MCQNYSDYAELCVGMNPILSFHSFIKKHKYKRPSCCYSFMILIILTNFVIILLFNPQVPIRMSPHFVTYHVESKTYCLVGSHSQPQTSYYKFNGEDKENTQENKGDR